MGKDLAARMDAPFIELDSINHQPNWVEIETPEFRRRVSEIVAQESWVIDGNYTKVSDLVLTRADTVIWLDYPLPFVLARLCRRILRRGILQEELWNGNRENLWRHLFTRESLILWVLRMHGRNRKRALEFCANPEFAHLVRIHFRDAKVADGWL